MKYLLGLLLLFGISTAQADVDLEKGYVVEASFTSTAPVQIVWDVLTDYNNIDKFVDSIKKSEFVEPNILKQKVKGRWWFFTKTLDLELRIKETLYNKIEFESVTSSGSFSIYQGAWEIKEDNVVSITYTLLAKPNFFVPKGIIRSVLKRETENYIEEISTEIENRNLIWQEYKKALKDAKEKEGIE